MTLHLPILPFLPAFLRRRETAELRPGNLRLVAADLRESLSNEAKLAAQLVEARLEVDLQAARVAALQLPSEEADQLIAEVQRLRTQHAGRSK